MYNFRSLGGAQFSYAVDFTDVNFANISFFDRSKQQIIFHLSLRKAKGVAAVNAKRNGEWQGEITKPVEIGAKIDKVDIRFADESVSVCIDGAELFHFDDGFAGLQTVQHLDFSGGLVPESFVMEGASNPKREGVGHLEHGKMFEVFGWGIDPWMPAQRVEIDVSGLQEPIKVRCYVKPNVAAEHKLSRDTKIGVQAMLPGRIWESDGAAQEVRLRVLSNGVGCGEPIVITKDEICRRIEGLLTRDDAQGEMFNILLAMEHVRFGNLWAKLSPKAQSVLKQAAQTYGAAEFLEETSPRGDDFTPPVRPVNDILVQQARRAFGAALSQPNAPDHIDVLETVMSRPPLVLQAQRALIQAVTDDFCLADKFEDLYQYCAVRGLHIFHPGKDPFYNSTILPFLCMEGRMSEIAGILRTLVDTKEGWIATPALGWTMRYVLASANSPKIDRVREAIIRSFIAFIDSRSTEYWARTRCVELIRATAMLVLQKNNRPGYLQKDIEVFVLRTYGLSRVFWDVLGKEAVACGQPLGARLEMAAEKFAAIQNYSSGKTAQVESAFEFFETCGNRDVKRYRLEMLGPFGIPNDAAATKEGPVLNRLMQRGRDPEESLVRGLAFPGVTAEISTDVVDYVKSGIRARHTETPRAAYYEQQVTFGRATTAFLVSLAKGDFGSDPAAAEETLHDLLGQVSLLASERSMFVGLGLALGLFNSLIRVEENTLATTALAHLGLMCAQMPEENQNNLFKQPAIFAALTSLAITAERRGSVLARSGMALFPRFEPGHVPSGRDVEQSAQHDALAPLFDTIVTVFSCKPYLKERIDAMRAGWLGKLDALGIPFVIIVGDGDGSTQGDIVHLEAPDTYEGLPQKALKAVEWVYQNTDYAYMLKIDDDCFVNVDEFFNSLSYRKFDYYGRRLERRIGQTDRAWHFAKSTSERGRKELDKSPEPSEYADGGSGYVLSRRAMGAVLRQAGTPAGQLLISASFMEDKMIGDLLSFEDIKVAEEDYFVSIRRRTHDKAEPVPLWQNSFAAGPLSPMKQVHLDTHTAQSTAMDRMDTPALLPKKIWPTFGPVRLGYQTNLLELMSSEDTLASVNKEEVAVVACVRNEMFMVPHFLAHYRKLGVKAFLIADNCSDDGTLEFLLEQPDVAVFSVDTSYGRSQYGVAWQMAILGNLRVGRWSLMADADEFLVYSGWEDTPLPELLKSEAFQTADAVRLYMLDMYPEGPLSKATFDSGDPFAEAGFVDKTPFLRDSTSRGPYSDSATVTSALRHRLLPESRLSLFVAQKYALLKYQPWMRPSAGLHYVAELKVAEMEMIFAHFKYNADFRAKAKAEVARGEHFNDAEEYRKYLALVSEGREVVYDAKVSIPWRACNEVKRILGA